MKKILIGLCDNAVKNRDKIRLWSESFRRVSDGEIVLLNANASKEDVWICDRLGISHVEIDEPDTFHINHRRLRHLKEFMEGSDADLVLATDVFDVVFQGDPFLKMESDKYDLFVSGEGVRVDEEPWNSDNIGKLFPEKADLCRGQEVICSGIIGGKREAMVALYERMESLCDSATDHHNIKDQAALIVAVSEGVEGLKVFNLDEGWAMHCAVAGPTPFFEGWGFKDKIKYGLPRMSDGTIVTSDGRPYDMVHQFNRIPEWHRSISENLLRPKGTCFVVSTYKRTLTGGGNENIKKIADALDNFFVLFDDHDGMDARTVSEAYGATACVYGDEDFRKLGFDKPIDTRHRWGSHQNPKYFYAHFRMLCFYIANPGMKYYWFLDDDVSFDGDLKSFFEAYEDSDEDFLAIQAFKKEEYPEFPRVSVINGRMLGSHGSWLELCPGMGDRFKSKERHLGSFFPIVRFSSRAMEHLLRLHEEGYYGYSEGFVPTSLASDGFKVASMMDEFNQFFLDDRTDCRLYHKGGEFTWEWL